MEQLARPGVKVGPVELVREIGRGGLGVVWEAVDRQSGRHVAFKAVRPGGKAGIRAARLLHEAEVAGRIVHPGIVSLLDVGRAAADPTWSSSSSAAGPWGLARLRAPSAGRGAAHRLASARAVAHAHAHGVVHRDLKPANVFLCEDGEVVLDSGLAHAFGQLRAGGGTPAYMAPEQCEAPPRTSGPTSSRSASFSTGCWPESSLPDDAGPTAPGPSRPRPLRSPGAPSIGPLL